MGERSGRAGPSVAVAALAAVAAEQHGSLTRRQALDAGLTPQQLRTAIEHGWLRSMGGGCYRIAGSPDTVTARDHLGLLVLGPQAVVSHEAAARLHGFDRTPTGVNEFTVPRSHRGRRLDLVVHTTDVLPRLDVVRVDGLAVTSATRTIIDLARQRPGERRVAAAIDSAVRTGRSAPAVLAERLAEIRSQGHWGVRLIDRLLPDSGGHTPIERRFLSVLRDAGLPRPTPQVVFRDGARTRARVDFFFAASRLVVEVSGRVGHASDSERARDAQRRNELQDLGLEVIEYTRAELWDRPAEIVTEMRRRLQRRLRHAELLPGNNSA